MHPLWPPKARPLYFTAVIYLRLAMGSQPNLASRSEVVSIYTCPQTFWRPSHKIGVQKNKVLDHFLRLPHCDGFGYHKMLPLVTRKSCQPPLCTVTIKNSAHCLFFNSRFCKVMTKWRFLIFLIKLLSRLGLLGLFEDITWIQFCMKHTNSFNGCFPA